MLLYQLGYSVKSVNKINAIIYILLHIENSKNHNCMTYQLTIALMWFHVQQETQYEMRIPERDDFLLLTYLRLSINQRICMETGK